MCLCVCVHVCVCVRACVSVSLICLSVIPLILAIQEGDQYAEVKNDRRKWW